MFYRLWHTIMRTFSNQWFERTVRQLMAEGDPAHLGQGG
jgi:hypothetical protein